MDTLLPRWESGLTCWGNGHHATLRSQGRGWDQPQLWGARAGNALVPLVKTSFFWVFEQIILNHSTPMLLLSSILATENLTGGQFHILKCRKIVPRLKFPAICRDVNFYFWIYFPPQQAFLYLIIEAYNGKAARTFSLNVANTTVITQPAVGTYRPRKDSGRSQCSSFDKACHLSCWRVENGLQKSPAAFILSFKVALNSPNNVLSELLMTPERRAFCCRNSSQEHPGQQSWRMCFKSTRQLDMC